MKIQRVNFEDKTLGNCGTGKIKAEQEAKANATPASKNILENFIT